MAAAFLKTAEFIESADARLLALGVIMRTVDAASGNVLVGPVPVTLQPTVLSRSSFAAVKATMPIWNRVIDRVARDFPFLLEVLEGSGASDPTFTGRYLEMLKEIYLPPNAAFQPLMLGLFRSDFLHNANSTGPDDDWKHVEINTISVSFAGLNPLVTDFHAYVAAVSSSATGAASAKADFDARAVRSESGVELPRGLKEAHDAWCVATAAARNTALPAIVCFVVQEGERNTGDQFLIAHELLLRHGVHSVRKTLGELRKDLVLEPSTSTGALPNARLGDRYVSVFYFRSCYTPKDFPTEEQWRARFDVETTSAIKCPSLPYYLCTMKKIQKALSDPTTLLKYCGGNKEDAAVLQKTFMGQFGLEKIGDAFTEAKIADAIAHPDKYVLKPQMEGGGNLVYGDRMVADLSTKQSDDPEHFAHVRNEYILMERIVVKEVDGLMMRRSTVFDFSRAANDPLCYELGTFGVLLSGGEGAMISNRYAGHLLRTKRVNDSDGGVMSGIAALDSLVLTDE